MNLSRLLAVAVALLMVVSVVPAFAPSVHAATLSTADLSTCVAQGGQANAAFDSSSGKAFVTTSISKDNFYVLTEATVFASGCLVVSGFTNILPQSVGGHGSLSNGPFAMTVLGGKVYATCWVSTNEICVAQISETGTLLNQWFYGSGSLGTSLDAHGIANDGTYLYIVTEGGVVKLDPSTGTFSILHLFGASTQDGTAIVYSSGTLTFTEDHYFGSVKTDGSGFSEVACSCNPSTEGLQLDGSGNPWFTDNANHNVVSYIGGAFHTYATGMTGDGPYGLVPFATGFKVMGGSNLKTMYFDTGNKTFVAADTKSTTDKPYYGYADGASAVYFGLGSFTLYKDSSSTTTSTTTTTTSAFVCTVYVIGSLTCPPSEALPTIQMESVTNAGPLPYHQTSMSSVTFNGFLWSPQFANGVQVAVKNFTYSLDYGKTWMGIGLGPTLAGSLCTWGLFNSNVDKVYSSWLTALTNGGCLGTVAIHYQTFNATVQVPLGFNVVRFYSFGVPQPVQGAVYVPATPFQDDQFVVRTA